MIQIGTCSENSRQLVLKALRISCSTGDADSPWKNWSSGLFLWHFSAFGGQFKIKHAVFDNGEQFKPEILLERNQFEFKMLSFAWYSFVKILNQDWFRETADKNFFFFFLTIRSFLKCSSFSSSSTFIFGSVVIL